MAHTPAVFADKCELVPAVVAGRRAQRRQELDVFSGGVAAREKVGELAVFPFQLAVVRSVTVRAAGTRPGERAVRRDAFSRSRQYVQSSGARKRSISCRPWARQHATAAATS